MNQKDPTPLPENAETVETEEEEERRFLDELDKDLLEADDPNCVWIPHDVVEEQMRRELAELDVLIKTGHK